MKLYRSRPYFVTETTTRTLLTKELGYTNLQAKEGKDYSFLGFDFKTNKLEWLVAPASFKEVTYTARYGVAQYAQVLSNTEMPILLRKRQKDIFPELKELDQNLFNNTILYYAHYNGKEVFRLSPKGFFAQKPNQIVQSSSAQYILFLIMALVFLSTQGKKARNYFLIDYSNLYQPYKKFFDQFLLIKPSQKEIIRINKIKFLKIALHTNIFAAAFKKHVFSMFGGDFWTVENHLINNVELITNLVQFIFDNNIKLCGVRENISHILRLGLEPNYGVFKIGKEKFNKRQMFEIRKLSTSYSNSKFTDDVYLHSFDTFIRIKLKPRVKMLIPLTDKPYFIFPSGLLVMGDVWRLGSTGYYLGIKRLVSI